MKKEKKPKKEKKYLEKKTLVIVESPAKAKTIEKYLGPSYIVKASMGHLIDLPKSRLAIDVEKNFEPEYITVRGRAKLLKELQGDAKKAETVLLASDNDREGEAIAWHLRNAITAKTDKVPIQRISFNEITPQAIKDAVAHPAAIDEFKVNAQKARRVLDRLVGYNLSPLLWKKVKNGLSAGRVQSVALRLICEREKEVESFIPEEYWTLEADFKVGKSSYTAQLVSWKDAKPELKSEAEVNAIIDIIKNGECVVSDVRETDKSVKPKPPFTTSQLQQTAANRLGFTSKKTMQIAQQLYEGVNMGSSRIGLITYMRTDSVRISQTALDEVREWIGKNFPKELPEKIVEYAVGKKAQDAHEAIRPTYVSYAPDDVKEHLTRDQLRLYSIIWERFVSSQMNNAKTRTVSADIKAGDGIFRIAGTKIIEKGFYQVMKVLSSRDEKGSSYPALKKGDKVKVDDFRPEQHFTQGPARFTDASIVKTLEEKGIGRPSTYAPIISVLLDRYYVVRSNKQLVPTVLGRLINDMLVDNFPNVVDAGFTASMETKLDEVEENTINWPDMIRDFWDPFIDRVDEVGKNLESQKGSLDEPTDKVCEKCGKPMMKKLGRFGYFLACSGFPECRNTKSIPLAKCPKCGGDVVARKTKGRGKEFYGCTNYPDCDFISHFKPLNQVCPKCGQFMVEKYDKKNGNHKACINPECDYLHSSEEEEEK
ncbi:type I DNA topoisomerase [Leadbettera azotonutricia]|uniref:DNA topoisomerase 1 n=1 Tax=Leadbettera azotonutricia (strain ATCC BAA-888 / DSM 13862 / ZAS-9) TaxID=545695 RepID=F5Y8Y5_LEAAZ|nr:type I DNA topoisomerase [Leadbettera azotonutricia]AEF80322.1 DNA topoisomerase [Leadbettera azotonutricia ZAS-9]